MDTKKFNIDITCKKCNSNNIRMIRHLDFTGWEDQQDYTGNVVLRCLDCNEEELVILEYEKLM